ncbi:EamA/RhaT family transporter [Jeotgalibacillus sp. ET6]|uniref:EamA family transporter n=1 Tax=Jeotgalibacillus sp. ET6 TaxID=3037260 RepID=UPI0024182B99|nr:EamA family transporter [Jeotgalibacillus sp. ET6]MDG5471549.1 EamA/RhaT family transporter [Jeotgalibacillus sp. ET6]
MNKILLSFQDNRTGILLMLAAALSTSLGQLLWKVSEGSINWALAGGFALYFLGAVFMMTAYRFGSLSVLHPFMSVGYIFAIFFGFFFIGEVITVNMLLGTSLILAGVLLIGGGDR